MSTLKKHYGFCKQERLCNFKLKKLLFETGTSFYEYPFRISWKVLDPNMESIFHAKEVSMYSQTDNPTLSTNNNPSYPGLKVHKNALFPFPVKLLVAASKKQHKSAPDRNHIKRRIRESYRKNKHCLYELMNHKGKVLILGIIYTSKTIHSYTEIEQKIVVSLHKLIKEIEKHHI